MMKKEFNKAAFKEKLDEQTTFPALYMFKFIVPKGKEDQVKELLPKHEVVFKESAKGTYVSATIKAMMRDSEAIMAVYDRASKIEGIISL
ncbi:DUF493 domain-containing protein [Echinicola strongylocentroti]|uniref:DUF493 domain-containing protein n=1 Tax=Echinicola strongylocentroti TaxID=1795355 RepID=A0A2Z4IJD4_9BACT|nr:DUF493 family protein [Echinicola strongylocentroti]AWW30513.1 DUF493 domain-containing protein [Echinicola strongylocentroti]